MPVKLVRYTSQNYASTLGSGLTKDRQPFQIYALCMPLRLKTLNIYFNRTVRILGMIVLQYILQFQVIFYKLHS